MTKSTVTTERLRQIASGNAFTCTQDDESAAMAAELLAVREAQSGWTNNHKADAALVMLDRIETTGFVDDDRIDEVKRLIRQIAAQPAPAQPLEVTDEMAMAFHRALTDSDIGSDDLDDIKIGLRGALCNYIAPPAPAVPDFGALTKLIVGRLIDCGTANDDSIADAEVFVYNACRAAMLQPVSQGYTLPAGWIACSDRMPTDETTVLVSNEENVVWIADVDHGGQFYPDEFPVAKMSAGEITHWIPLPAAPTPTK